MDLSPKPGHDVPIGRDEAKKYNFGKLMGDDFLLFGGPKKKTVDAQSSRVNRYLWQASLDVVSFMPLQSVDASGGVIVTDWYSAPQSPQERIKVTIYITDPALRADALQVKIFKQIRKGNDWQNVTPDAKTSTDLEDIILSKARQLKIKTAQS
jgi:hypothetical protein